MFQRPSRVILPKFLSKRVIMPWMQFAVVIGLFRMTPKQLKLTERKNATE